AAGRRGRRLPAQRVVADRARPRRGLTPLPARWPLASVASPGRRASRCPGARSCDQLDRRHLRTGWVGSARTSRTDERVMMAAAARIGVRLIAMVIGVQVSIATRKAVEGAWRAARPEDPPRKPSEKGVRWADAVAWGAMSAAGVVVAD